MVAQLDDLHPLGVLVQPAAELLHLELELEQAPEDELQLLAADRPALSLDRLRPAGPGGGVPGPSSTSAGMSVARISAPGASTTMLSIRFRSWRTLPGQGALTSRCIASGVMPRKVRSCARASSRMNRRTRSGMSSRRSRSGGR